MGFFSKFPYSNGYQLNLDWIIGKIKKFESDYNQLDPDSFLRKSGGEVDGALRFGDGGSINMNGKPLTGIPSPTASADAASKEYVDRKIGTPEAPGAYLPLAGGMMSGDINMYGHSITGIPNAVEDSDALALAFARSLFAPNGYGLGVSKPSRELTNCNEGLEIGWYIVGNNASNAPQERSFWMRVDAFSASYLCQTAYTELSNGLVCMRYCVGGNWQPWEWVNPPMNLGVEYRTTERVNGSVVYAKRVSFGNLPANTYKVLSLDVPSGSTIRFDVLATVDSQKRIFPLFSGTSLIASAYIDAYGAIIITTFADISNYTAVVDVWYTK